MQQIYIAVTCNYTAGSWPRLLHINKYPDLIFFPPTFAEHVLKARY